MSNEKQLVDPDPFTVTAVCLAGVSVCLQIVQVWQGFRKNNSEPSSSVGQAQQRPTVASQIEDAAGDFLRVLDRIERLIRREENSPDKKFYESKFRIGNSMMEFSLNGSREYTRNLSKLTLAFTHLSTWINDHVMNDPELTALLGREISDQVGDAKERLNEMIAEGASTESILSECRLIVGALRNAVSAILRSGNN